MDSFEKATSRPARLQVRRGHSGNALQCPLDRLNKILLVANTGWYLHNFKRGLLQALVDQEKEVGIVCPHDKYVGELEQIGARWIELPLSRFGMNPLVDGVTAHVLRRIYIAERPDLVHHFTTKPILYGTLAARSAGVPRVVNTVTGLGSFFLSDRLLARAIRPIVRSWLSRLLAAPGVRSIFQNEDDLAHLSRHFPMVSAAATMANGSGVDIQRFAPASHAASLLGQRLCVIFVGRLLRNKGIHEFVEAARPRQCGPICRLRRARSRQFFVG